MQSPPLRHKLATRSGGRDVEKDGSIQNLARTAAGHCRRAVIRRDPKASGQLRAGVKAARSSLMLLWPKLAVWPASRPRLTSAVAFGRSRPSWSPRPRRAIRCGLPCRQHPPHAGRLGTANQLRLRVPLKKRPADELPQGCCVTWLWTRSFPALNIKHHKHW